jgi:putative membrane protein
VKHLILMLKGMAFGFGNIVPGLNGVTMLMAVGIYEQFVDAVGNLLVQRSRWKELLPFLASLGLGTLVAMVGLSGIMSWLLQRYPASVMLLSMGLVVGTIPSLLKSHGDMRPTPTRAVMLLGGLALVVLTSFERQGLEGSFSAVSSGIGGLLYRLATSFVAGAANVAPGVSGSYILLLTGMYPSIMGALSALARLSIQWSVLVPTGLGAVLGIVVFSKLIDTALKRAPSPTYYLILGLVAGSVYGLWPHTWRTTHPLALALPFAAGAALTLLVARREQPQPEGQ